MDKENTFISQIRIPVGNSNFQEIREKDMYYVDKTGFISELLNYTDKVQLITRPRRFGKTLMMSMLKCFFDIEQDNRVLFSGLEIGRNKVLCAEWMNQCPVVFLTFKEIEGLDFESAYDCLKDVLAEIFNQYSFILDADNVNDYDRKLFTNLQNGMASKMEVKKSLKLLTRLLYAHYNKQVIILLDEYDVPLAKAHERGYYEEMLDLMRGMLQVLKDNDCLNFAVLTGCLRVSKESVFTGVNNFSTSSIISKNFNRYFGFTEKDVQQLLKDFGMSEQYSLVKEWYDGYNFGSVDMYCPWDVTCYVMDYVRSKRQMPACYWAGSSDNSIIRTFIDKYRNLIKTDFEKLLNGEVVRKQVSLNLTYDELQDSVDNFWSVLLLSGYLTTERNDDYYEMATEDGGVFSLKIPNTEVREIFINTIDKWMQAASGKLWDISKLINAIWEKDIDVMSQEITNILRKTISYFDYSENFYHAFLAGILSGAGQVVKTNPETGMGRSDIILEDSDNSRVVIFELKRTKEEKQLEAFCEQALTQIKNMGYADEYADDYNEIICYGISFYKKKCLVKVEN